MQHDAALIEADRVMTLCNACRYCEGYCAVFPAMERRLSFKPEDLEYLANLCHSCGECYYACQYAPPHEFAVNVPRTMTRVRGHTYEQYAWPGVLGRAYQRAGVVTATSIAFGLIIMLFVAAGLAGGIAALGRPVAGGDFYQVLPHSVMVTIFGCVFLFSVIALGLSTRRFWRSIGESGAHLRDMDSWRDAWAAAVRLDNLHSGGAGCPYPDERHAPWRRWFHHLTFYGFLLCFAATSVATIYHYVLGWHAPYPYLSLPKLAGIVGGMGLIVGPLGLLWLRRRRDPGPAEPGQDSLDLGLISLLVLSSLSGLLLTLLRESALLASLLITHLGFVLALFVTLPYGKFVHGLYRTAALLKCALEKRRSPAFRPVAD